MTNEGLIIKVTKEMFMYKNLYEYKQEEYNKNIKKICELEDKITALKIELNDLKEPINEVTINI